MRRSLFFFLLFLGGCTAVTLPFGWTVNFAGTSGEPLPEQQLAQLIRVPEGFGISYYAVGIENARMLRFTRSGDLLVSAPRTGRVFLLERDRNQDGRADAVRVLLEGLNRPHGLALDEKWLYVAEADVVVRVPFDHTGGKVTGPLDRIIRGLPEGGRHWTRTIGIGPDGYLYLAVGSSCNVCVEEDPRRAAISRYDRDGGNGRIYATGLRNAVGFAWHPGTLGLYATDNGRDLLGDDFPPCELDLVVDGGDYGWPYANGDRVPDPDYGSAQDKVSASIAPAYDFAAHTAPLGITFYTGRAFPERYRNAALVALHGSWNRSTKSGYKVVTLLFGDDGKITEEDFAAGFEANDDVAGRPVDVAIGPDGAAYISDDFTGAIYRVAYGSPIAGGKAPSPNLGAPAAKAATGEMNPHLRAVALDRGRDLWEEHHCAACHEQGGDPKSYRPLAGLRNKFDVTSLMTFLKTPQPPMPVFPLSDFDRRDLAVFLLDRYP